MKPVAKEPRGVSSRAAGVLPLGFRGKPHIHSGLLGDLTAESQRVRFADIVDGAVRRLGRSAGILCHDDLNSKFDDFARS